MKILVTGGAGFIGSHIIEHLLERKDYELTILDSLNYAGRLDRLAQWRNHPRVRFKFHNLRAPISASLMADIDSPDWIIHSAAETHVENSLRDPLVFVESNVLGTFNILQAAREWQIKKLLYVSTDEVFGPAPVGVDYDEDARFAPSNPYSASKAGGECLVMAWATSFKLPVIISRTMNNFGERQHPEKYVPMVVHRVLTEQSVPIHWNGKIFGSRMWLHARNHADGIRFLLESGQAGTFHIAGEEHNNLEIAKYIAESLELPLRYDKVNFHESRPGHDLRYSLSDSKIRSLGWKPPVDFTESLRRTVLWTRSHSEWLKGI